MSFAPETISYEDAFDRLDDMGQFSGDEIRAQLIAQGYPDPELEAAGAAEQQALGSALIRGEVAFG